MIYMVWTFIWEKKKEKEIVALTDNKTNLSYMKDVPTKLSIK